MLELNVGDPRSHLWIKEFQQIWSPPVTSNIYRSLDTHSRGSVYWCHNLWDRTGDIDIYKWLIKILVEVTQDSRLI